MDEKETHEVRETQKNENPDNESITIPPIELIREELAREESRHNFRKTVWNVMAALIVVAAIAVLVVTRLFVLVRVNGNSMEPALLDGDVLFVLQTKELNKGDIAGFYYGGKVLLKRTIGDPGDIIEIDREGNVSVNGEELEEPYLTEKNLGKCELEFPYEVPEELTFVLGDNRAVSIDSRIKAIGCIEEDQILGKAVFRAWPLDRIGSVH